ncbi:MAG: ATP-binding protein [Gammaproteobacteria bacterium]|nr:ATP-binding protein [Gammaproteobacteria bacterium]
MSITERLRELATIDVFRDVAREDAFIGRPFYFDFNKMKLLSNDHWKERVGGVPAGAFLAALFDRDDDNPEVVLLRVLGPTALPTDSDVVAAMVDYYKESQTANTDAGHLDSYTRYEFQFSGLECRVLGSFYRDATGNTRFGADVDNFYGPNNYSVYKPSGSVLEYIVNFRQGDELPGGPGDQRIGQVRYASSRRHVQNDSVPLYVSALDYLGKRTALFGMTRTGKSNTVKMIIRATTELAASVQGAQSATVSPVGQIVFDVNGEYANSNLQDEGTAIYQLYEDDVTRYSILQKPGFKVMKLNFYRQVRQGQEMIRAGLQDDTAIYTQAFLNVDWEEPDSADYSAMTRHGRRLACYQAILEAAGFPVPAAHRVAFVGTAAADQATGLDPRAGLTPREAGRWFLWVWDNYNDAPAFAEYRQRNNHEWADDDLKNLMRFLTRKSRPGGAPSEAGFRKLIPLRDLHTDTLQASYEEEVVSLLRNGKIVIIDLSQGNPVIQRTYSDRLCSAIFQEAMDRFVNNNPGNYIQMYFEEAHNLFPKRTDSDLTLVYNRIAKEGAKLGLGLAYATQEVSSISANVLKNTQNWFVSHLNNQEELREIAKYYDFEDFIDSLRRTTDKGFIRMKTYSNAFTVPVQIDRFTVAGG